ncbi:Cof-type HAD-IIB family hydrolase [Microbacterium fluvii]|uniref:Cof-type HAD-IIB family hydrolase n=1 Tax=Microbacterium fluvii TaxID=415215 RepID=A0ABW2HEK2_9MICO|nr:HAD family hydrolase [Microbacterium fluvii]MCU4672936.1 Cof-type HAD-IIB family hydrolase [Microbacterium fluvii]
MTSSRIAFLDVDGTILDHGRTVAPSTVEAIRGARAAGHLVLLSTGRSAADIHPEVRAIGFDGAITNGGAFATVGDETVVARPMPRAAAQRLMAYFDEHGIHFFLQSDDGVYASARVRELVSSLASRWMQRPDNVAMPRFHDLDGIDMDAVAKAVFVSDRTGTVDQVQADLGASFHVVPGSMPLPGGSNGEVGLRGVTKGSAITTVLEHLGRTAADAIGIGDSWNDVEMFEVCGVGIAMGNAEPELQERADEITTSVAHDGVYNAFVKHGLIPG